MTRNEIKAILMRIQATYPNWKPPGTMELVINVWHEYLQEFTYEDILRGVKAYALSDTSGFAPTVGQILSKLNTMQKDDTENGCLQAWALVSKALRNGNYGAEEEFEKLPPLVQKAVGSPMNIRNWALSDEKATETVIMSQFLSTYKSILAREKEMAMIPKSLRIGTQDSTVKRIGEAKS